MDQKTLIKDLALIVILIVAGLLIYLALPSTNTMQTNDTAGQNSNTNEQQTGAQLRVEVITEGTGKTAENNTRVSVNYRGTLEDGTEFDSSYRRNQAFEFNLGRGEVIPGWELGVLGMKVGEKRKLVIPPQLAYGAGGVPGVIPPNATLIFEVELVGVN